MTRALCVLLGCALVVCALGACDDGLDQRLAIIDQPRVLAVIAEPAEARPGAMIAYRAVIAAPDGPVDAAPRWAFCVAPKPPTEDNAVSAACLGDQGDAIIALGAAPQITAQLPADGCLQFGPDTPSADFRPRDADASGGYYQPIRAELDGLLAFGLSRITCNLATAPPDVARAYDVQYVANHNPTLDPIVLPALAADRDVTLTASWPADAAEPYLSYDPQSQTLVPRREAMRLSWFATGGTLAVDASAISETDPTTTVSTTWHTPAAGSAFLWLILRDSRGGLAAQALRADVAP